MEKIYQDLQFLVEKVNSKFNLSKKENKKETNKMVLVTEINFSNPEEYLEKTGRRFRITKEQKARGLTREQAFDEFLVTLKEKLNSIPVSEAPTTDTTTVETPVVEAGQQ